MSSIGDETNLLLELHSGERGSPRWRGFLDALARRREADGAALWFSFSSLARAVCWESSGGGGLPTGLADMRPNRVYGADELGGDFTRALRVTSQDAWSAWLLVRRTGGDFSAADGARLAALAPHFFVAMDNFAALERERLRAAAAEEALRRAGLAWRACDESSCPAAAAELAVELPVASLATRPEANIIILARTDTQLRDEALSVLQRMWSLSLSEARFTLAVANGQSIAGAADAAGLTVETARNYSKRIYAKAGARGLPDLVRRVLNSVAPLA